METIVEFLVKYLPQRRDPCQCQDVAIYVNGVRESQGFKVCGACTDLAYTLLHNLSLDGLVIAPIDETRKIGNWKP